MVTETARVQVREFTVSDAATLSEILSDPLVMKFSSKGPLSERETLEFIEWCISSYQEHGFGQWAVIEKKSGALIGCCGLSQTAIDGVEEVEIGYRLLQNRWGLGFATEVASEVLDYGFDSCNIKSIVGIVSPRHTASIQVLEKIGFRSFFETLYSGWDVRVYRITQEYRKSYNTSLQADGITSASLRQDRA
ncbi:GNAT family N-acetyltransferase [Nitrincola sp. MINF-07-Sa-05]|uniref:GNAT family N-acetyltransferase n=1 Tax=Nitrincola salilacus TaxID=3400273 RepID=UPI00391836A6